MHKILLFLVSVLSVFMLQAQELNALVTVNHNKISGSNKQVFSTLQKSLTEFINQNKWTERNVKPQERINCAFNIIINSRSSNSYKASIQVQSMRPIFNTTYDSPVLNLKDDNFSFDYSEFEPLTYNKTTFDSNLVSTIAFYVYIILGVDADTFAPKGGENYLKEAENTMLKAQQSGDAAWSNQVGKLNRFSLIDNLLSDKLSAFRNLMYTYHRKGFDRLSVDKKEATQSIENSIVQLDKIHNKTIGNHLIRLFLDAKADEIVNVYSERTSTQKKQKLTEVLQKISPNNNSKWQKIK